MLIIQTTTHYAMAYELPVRYGPDICYNADGSEKKIKISYTQTQATDTSPIKLDASGSTVPSGDISYRWNPNKPSAGFEPVYTLEDSAKGYSRTTQLQIVDLTCNIHLVTSFEVYSK